MKNKTNFAQEMQIWLKNYKLSKHKNHKIKIIHLKVGNFLKKVMIYLSLQRWSKERSKRMKSYNYLKFSRKQICSLPLLKTKSTLSNFCPTNHTQFQESNGKKDKILVEIVFLLHLEKNYSLKATVYVSFKGSPTLFINRKILKLTRNNQMESKQITITSKQIPSYLS